MRWPNPTIWSALLSKLKFRERSPWPVFTQDTIVARLPFRESTSESIWGGNRASEMDGMQVAWRSDSFFNWVQGLKMDRENPPISFKDASMIPGDQRQSRKALWNVAGKSDNTNGIVLGSVPVASIWCRSDKVIFSNDDVSICRIDDAWLYHCLLLVDILLSVMIISRVRM